MSDGQTPRVPLPPAEFLASLSDVSDRAAAGYGYLAGLQAAGATPGFGPVKAPAAVAKLYVLAALDEVGLALATTRARLTADLSGEEPFKLLIAAEEHVQRRAGEGRAKLRRNPTSASM